MAIEKLNNDGVIDMTVPPKDNTPKEESKITVNMSRGKTVPSASRETVAAGDILPNEKVTHGNPTKPKIDEGDILDLTNPNSPFSKYVSEKKVEMEERLAVEEERVREAVENGELDPEGEIAKSWGIGDEEKASSNTVRIDLDLDDEEEEGEEVEANNISDTLDDIKGEVEHPGEQVKETTPEEDDIFKDDTPEEDANAADVDLGDIIGDEEDEELDEDEEIMEKELGKAADEYIKSKNESTEEKEEAKKVEGSTISMNLEMSSKKVDEVEDDEEADDVTTDNDEIVNKLRKMATEKLKPKSAVIDISNFVVGKPSTKSISPIINQSESKVAKWVLPNQEQIVLMREFSGVDLQTFVATAGSASVANMSRRFRLIYNHIESPKPETFEAWLKSTPFADLDHYYFAVYVASFNGVNYIPVDCKNNRCTEGTFVSDDVPIMDMVKFNDDDIKKKFKKIYKEEPVNINPQGLYILNRIPINNDFAIGFKQPSLYDFIESLNVDEAFANKYANMLRLIPYIDNMYTINHQAQQLDPIGYKTFEGNTTKTFKSKVRKYNTVLTHLSPDEFSLIEAYSNDIDNRNDGITYITPSLKCPYCGTESDETVMSAESLVFTRYQLGALVNTTLK